MTSTETEEHAATTPPKAPPPNFARMLKWVAFIAAVVALGAVLLFVSGRDNTWYSMGLATLVLFASAAIGAFGGFLFGVPRMSPNADQTAKPKKILFANTTFEKISDWFATLVVALGIAEFRELISAARLLAARLGSAFGDAPGGPRAGAFFGISLVIGGLLVSFLISYMWVRTRLYIALRDQEEARAS